MMTNLSSNVDHLRQQYYVGMSRNNELILQYYQKQIQDGEQLTRAATQTLPRVQINIATDPQNPYFTLVMADPDAPQRGNEHAGPWLHWIQTGFTGNNVSNGITLADYQGPSPPSGTGPHQYIFLLYKSPAGAISQTGGSIGVSDSANRKQFNLRKFEHDNSLQLVAATSYTVNG